MVQAIAIALIAAARGGAKTQMFDSAALTALPHYGVEAAAALLALGRPRVALADAAINVVGGLFENGACRDKGVTQQLEKVGQKVLDFAAMKQAGRTRAA